MHVVNTFQIVVFHLRAINAEPLPGMAMLNDQYISILSEYLDKIPCICIDLTIPVTGLFYFHLRNS